MLMLPMGFNPPTIGHVLHRLHRAGAEVLAAALAHQLQTRYRFAFLCLDEIGPLGEQLRRAGFAVIELGRRPGLDFAVAGRLRRVVADEGIDLLHAHQYTPFFYSALSRMGTLPGFPGEGPILFTEHGRHYPDPRKLKRIVANRALLRDHDRVTAVGEFVKRALVRNEGLPAPRIEVIHNGIEPGPAATPAERRAARRVLGLDDHDRVVMQVARFHPVKDHETSLRAFALVADRLTRAKLVLVGDGEGRAACEALARELGVADRVVFTGVREDVAVLLPAADVFVLSSLSEGVSVTLLEAMAAGVPICATRVGGNGEVVDHGRTGLLSPRRDPGTLAEHVASLLSDPHRRAAMGEAGRRRLLARFTQAQMHAAYAACYDAMLGSRSKMVA